MPEPHIASESSLAPNIKQEIARNYRFYMFRPANPNLCLRLGNLLETAGDLRQAVVWYEEAARLNPSSATIDLLATRYAWLNEPQKAFEVSRRENHSEPHDLADVIKAAELAEWAKKTFESALLYQKAYAISGQQKHLEMAIERMLWAKEPQKALQLMKKLRKLRPRDLNLIEKMADTAEWAKDLPQAISLLIEAEHIRPKVERQKKIGECLIWSGKPQDGLVWLAPLVQSAKWRKAVILPYSEALDVIGAATASLELLDSVVPIDLPPSRLLRRAVLRSEQKRFDESLSDIGMLLRRSSKAIEPQVRFQALLVGARSAGELKHLSETIKYFSEAFQISQKPSRGFSVQLSDQIFILRQISGLARQTSQLKLEQWALGRLFNMDQSQTDIPARMAQLLLEDQKVGDALSYAEAAVRLAPDDCNSRRILAEILITLRRPREAQVHLEFLFNQGVEDEFVRTHLKQFYQDQKDENGLLSVLWQEWQTWPNRDLLLIMAPLLIRNGFSEKAVELLAGLLRKDPSDSQLEELLNNQIAIVPKFVKDFQHRRPQIVDDLHLTAIASETGFLETHPDDYDARYRRAKVQLWRSKPKDALPDFQILVTKRPQDATLLEETANVAEWADQRKTAMALRWKLHQVSSEYATNTLRLAQELTWNRRPRAAYPLIKELEKSAGISDIEKNLIAVPVFRLAGLFKAMRDIHRQLAAAQKYLSALQRNEWLRQNRDIRDQVGPLNQVRILYSHDTEQVQHHTYETFSRFQVEDGSWQSLRLTQHSVSQLKDSHRPFSGTELRWQLFRQSDLCNQYEIGVHGLSNQNDRNGRMYVPSLSWKRSSDKLEQSLAFTEEPLFDTPEATRRDIRLRSVTWSWQQHPTTNQTLSTWAKIGKFQPGSYLREGGVSLEETYRSSPRRGWRYQYSLHESGGEGGTIYYAPPRNGTHSISWIGESYPSIQRPRNRPRLNWELFAGKEDRGAKFFGTYVSLAGNYHNQTGWRVEASSLNSNQSHFGGVGGYGQWYSGVSLEWRKW
ncbi:MAG: hypothetical protein HQM09_03550 [Candidatus Riflebacteria bacterium]|nr:hypothetical protein [Candidatus Riflebacteria bacterium]